ncbi:MAG: ATP-binding cassette domain-containing protein [Acidobacteria bacterium]|nr:ATP-binding cassette domain-containing protein [Acidobacteriota bacterium]
MIEVNGLSKSFGATVAVNEMTFTARDGAVTGVLGPNGSGKTTTLRILAGLLAPRGGSVTVDGIDVAKDPRGAQAKLGVLPDGAGLYGRLTPREHLEYSGGLQGLRGADLEARVSAALRATGLESLADRRAQGFSLGERRRVALARTLVHEPVNLLLDEPTNGLDVPGARAVRKTLRALAGAGRCVVMSSHVMSEVATLCDQVVVVARGRVVAEGSPRDLLERTGKTDLEDAFVALLGTEEGLGK